MMHLCRAVLLTGLVLSIVAFDMDLARAATLVVDTHPRDCLGGAPTSGTIAGAAAFASPGDTIKVCNGTYVEAVTIATRNLTLQSVNSLGVIIQAPGLLSAGRAIVDITGVGVTLQGFVISGPGPGPCGSIEAGVLIHGSGSAKIIDNEIINVADSPFGGCQNGFGIQVGEDFDNGGVIASSQDMGTGTLTNNTISGYQKGGILVDGEGSSATITGNIVMGAGSTGVIAQNGIEITETSLSNVISGNTVTDNVYSKPDAEAIGVFEFQAGKNGDKNKIPKANTLMHNQDDVEIVP
jgi:hypothetical protein